ncbi:hypothetical protein E2562_001083 [Oryza meyeriana var. granulata]|uniref:PLC-like phosphodiesterases superfamily protein n=1 Tax=Oryza meyeriana var. granulata TaxID=110450 RepID=A0A6G1EDM3_9ORYZ|nr:hypothetical protein E2562_001083 [Oryza meyeriana var. granulata]
MNVSKKVPALYTLREIEGFLVANPSEIVTLILEDHVASRDGLTKLFNKTGLRMYWFPVEKMPRNGDDWPIVSDMIKNNHRLLVFTSNRSKESSEGIAYQWNYMVENQSSMDHSRGLKDVLKSCHAATGNRWANFLAVDFYKRSDGGGVFEAIDILNGRLICGLNDVSSCRVQISTMEVAMWL